MSYWEIEGETHRVPTNACPNCGFLKLNAMTNITGAKEGPDPGNVTICFECSFPMLITEDHKFRKLTYDEFKEWDQAVGLTKMIDHVSQMREKRDEIRRSLKN